MSTPITVSVPHRLGRAEAVRRLKDGLARTHGQFGPIASFDQQTWAGDTLDFHVRVLGQGANGSIEVRDDALVITLALPWLLAKVAERFVPALRKEATLMLEKK